MKRILTWTATILLAVGGLILAFWPVQTWRLYDANWNPLAMTHAESWCMGRIAAENNYINSKDDPRVDQCVLESNFDNTIPSIGKAIRWGCVGSVSADSGWSVSDCIRTVEAWDVWFLQHGGWTWEWNDAHPRPVVAYSDIRNAPRGERDDSIRDSGGRFGE